jgi:gamma-glutamyl-gamma-aminobutyrate hydrolase PuuD
MPNEYDLNGNGKIDPVEHEIMLEDRRRRMEDADAKRDAQRRMTWFALSGMILYPFVILVASMTGLETAAKLMADIAAVYVIGASGIAAAYFGFNAMESKNASNSDRSSS